MTNQNAITPTSYELANVNEAAMKRLTSQLVSSMTGAGGRPLSPLHAAQIALISLTTDLSPFLGEVYATDKGIMIGVLAYERKAQEYMDAFLPGMNYHITYRPAVAGKDGDFDSERDVAYVARLTRDDWDRQWQVKLQDFIRTLKEASITGREAYEIAISELGPKPYAEAVGIVDGRENFSGTFDRGEYAGQERPEMFDRHERAKKRARKNVLKHEFPRLSIPDPIKILSDESAHRLIEVSQKAPEYRVIEAGTASRETEILGDLVFGDAGQYPDYEESDFDPALLTKPHDPEVDAIEPAATMTLETAQNITNSKGQRYGDLDKKTLSFMSSSISKKMKLSDLPHEEREACQMKLDAIRLLLAQ